MRNNQMYRCYVIYNMQRWVLIFPLTLYLASICKYVSAETHSYT